MGEFGFYYFIIQGYFTPRRAYVKSRNRFHKQLAF